MKINKNLYLPAALCVALIVSSCGGDNGSKPTLKIPETYVSAKFAANTTAEAGVVSALKTVSDAANKAEKDAQKAGTTVAAIPYPAALSSVTLPAYKKLIDAWLVELVKAANSPDGFQIPGASGPTAGQEGGLLDTRLLDENGLELEQMIQKGSFGATFYNHALTVINGKLTSASTDKLIKIFGTDVNFTWKDAKDAAKYARRRSNKTTKKGAFYEIQKNLITAKAAIEAGSTFTKERDKALNDFLLNWEKSNFATVIYYCNAAKKSLQTLKTTKTYKVKADALHAYAEAVAFAHGFKGVSKKKITDAQIDEVLKLLLAPAGQKPESYKFLKDANLLGNLEQAIAKIKSVYGFTDAEVNSFYTNDPE